MGSPDPSAAVAFYSGLFGWAVDENPAPEAGFDELEVHAGFGTAKASSRKDATRVKMQLDATGPGFWRAPDGRDGVQRRVQYYLFMQVLDVETGEILFQNKSAITKAIIRT